MIGNIYYAQEISIIYPVYRIEPFTAQFFISLFGTYVLYLLLLKVRFPSFRSKLFSEISSTIGRKYLKCRLLFAILCIALGLYVSLNSLLGYRYGPSGLLDSGTFLIVILIICPLIITCDVFYHIFVIKHHKEYERSKYRLASFLISVSGLLLANGTATMLLALFVFIFMNFPRLRVKFLYKTSAVNFKLSFQWIASALVLLIVLLGAFHFGNRIKHAGSFFSSVNSETSRTINIEHKIVSLLGRVSSYYYSLLYTSSKEMKSSDVPNIVIPFETGMYRLNALFNKPFILPKSTIQTFSRLNYLNLSLTKDHAREGTSAGIISSFDYVFDFPISILLCALFLKWCSGLIDILTKSSNKKLTWFGALFVFLFLEFIFQSPFDLLVLIDNGSLLALILYGMAKQQGRGGQVASIHKHVPALVNVDGLNSI